MYVISLFGETKAYRGLSFSPLLIPLLLICLIEDQVIFDNSSVFNEIIVVPYLPSAQVYDRDP
jgi:hypothetical protein